MPAPEATEKYRGGGSMEWKKVAQATEEYRMSEERRKYLGELSKVMNYKTIRVDLIVDYLREKGFIKPHWYLISKTIRRRELGYGDADVRFNVGIPREDNHNCLVEGIAVLVVLNWDECVEIFIA